MSPAVTDALELRMAVTISLTVKRKRASFVGSISTRISRSEPPKTLTLPTPATRSNAVFKNVFREFSEVMNWRGVSGITLDDEPGDGLVFRACGF